MKIKNLQISFVVLITLSVFSSMFVGDVSQARAQSSRQWEEPINLSNSGGASGPMVVVDTLGVMHALWVDEFDGFKYAKSEDGKIWTTPIKGKYPFVSPILSPEASLPTFMTGSKGFVHVFWQSNNNALVYAQAQSENLDDPSAWAFQTQITANVLVYDGIVDAQGVLHVAYIRNVDNAPGPIGVYYVRSLDEGRSWSEEKLLYESQYFRTTDSSMAHIQVAVSSEPGDERINVVWDNTSLRRIFMATSKDSGSVWMDAVQLKSVDDTGGYNTPYNANISFNGTNNLLVWEVGKPGSGQCILYAQWSTDGVTWGEPDAVLNDQTVCPIGIDFLVNRDDSIIMMMRYGQGNPALIAWNGTEWSEPQFQNELSYFLNPITKETILLGCQNYFYNGSRLYIVGCDESGGSDVWLTSRAVEFADDRGFSSSSSLWNLPTLLKNTDQRISSLIYASDEKYLHALWSQSYPANDGTTKEAVNYSRWDGSEWSSPVGVISDLSGLVGEMSASSDGLDRLFLVWADKNSGELLFSWANSSEANNPSEWDGPRDLPSPSKWTGSPDIVVDSSGTIIIVYAVPINENRGIYMIKSTDNGVTWSSPNIVFDAGAAGMSMVNRPSVALGSDGRLHVLFSRYSGLGNQPDGLLYSQSFDGGVSWSVPEVVSEGLIMWSNIDSYDNNTLHRVWQLNDGSVVVNLDQVSTDNGASWGEVINIAGVNDETTPITLVSNNSGELHFFQLVDESHSIHIDTYYLTLQDWKWNGKSWDSQPFQKMEIKGTGAEFLIAAGISRKGYISASILAEYDDLNGDIQNEIYNIGRLLSDFDTNAAPFSAVINNPDGSSVSVPSATAVMQTGLLPEATPYLDLSGTTTPSGLSKNLWGVFLILFVAGVITFIFFRKTK